MSVGIQRESTGGGVGEQHRSGAWFSEWLRSTFFVSFAVAFAALTLWAFSNPMFGAPDEPFHMVRSTSIVRLESGSTMMTTLPAIPAWPCFSWVPIKQWTADCQNLKFPTAPVAQTNRAGNYPPLAHVIYGLPTLFMDGMPMLYAM